MQEMEETQVRSLGQEDPLEEEMATHSSISAWRIPWREEPCSPWGRKRVGHNRMTKHQHTMCQIHSNSLLLFLKYKINIFTCFYMLESYLFFFFKIYLCILCFGCLYCCKRAFSGCSECGLFFVEVHELFTVAASLVVKHGLQVWGFSGCSRRALECGLSSCGEQAYLL